MDKTDIASVLFALVGASFLVRFALDPALTGYSLTSVLVGVGFISAGILMFRRRQQNTTNFNVSLTALALAVVSCMIGVGVYLGM